MDLDNPVPPLPRFVTTILGGLLILLAMFFLGAASPQLFFPATENDLIGAVAGLTLILIVGIPGILLIMREKSPTLLVRSFHILLGSLSILAGLGIVAYVVYQGSTGNMRPRKAFLTVPILMIAGGAVWLRKGFSPNIKPETADAIGESSES